MKELYWIDDNINKIGEYAEGIFKDLWGDKGEEGVASKILVFGDDYKRSETERNWNHEAEKKLNEKIQNYLMAHCRDIDMWNFSESVSTYSEKKNLINDMTKLIDMENAELKQLILNWKRIEKDADVNDEKLSVKKLIDQMKIPKRVGVMLDVALLSGDRTRVLHNGVPIISMKLYETLKEEKHECILYSSFTYDYPFIEKWIEIYNEGKEAEKCVKKIYSGKDLLDKANRQEIIMKLKNTLNENVQTKDVEEDGEYARDR